METVLNGNIDNLINTALAEDLGNGDVTTDATITNDQISTAAFIAKETGILAGISVVKTVFNKVDPTLKFDTRYEDGQKVEKGTKFATVQGKTSSILKAERTALNFIQRMSGVATQTALYVNAVKPYKAKVLDTRKTIPSFRYLDKLAVKLGGGTNHRMGLYDMALIKDNHIFAVGSISKAIKSVRTKYPNLKIEVEVKNIEELKEALTNLPDRIMLDNMSTQTMIQAVDITSGKVPLEASGNVTLENINEIAKTGVDFISVGALTHSVKALDISLKII